MNSAVNAMNRMRVGNTQNIAETLDLPLYDTLVLADGAASQFDMFDRSKSERGSDLALTNVQIGGRVPSKQEWEVHGYKIEVIAPGVLTDAALATLGDYLANTSIEYKQDTFTKLETTLSALLGSATLVASAAAQGAQHLNATYTGNYKLKIPFILGSESTFEYHLVNKKYSTVPAVLDGVQIKIFQQRIYSKLVA